MENISELKRLIDGEITTIKKQEIFHQSLQILAVLTVLVIGGVTTIIAATEYADKFVIALLAASTTFVGVLEKTFNFRKNANAYRQTKTEFQNLEIDVNRTDGSDSEDLFKELQEIRTNKAIRTTA